MHPVINEDSQSVAPTSNISNNSSRITVNLVRGWMPRHKLTGRIRPEFLGSRVTRM